MAVSKLRDDESADPLAVAARALDCVEAYVAQVQKVVQDRIVQDGRVKSAKVNLEQRAVHGYAWIETTYMALRSVHKWACERAERGAL